CLVESPDRIEAITPSQQTGACNCTTFTVKSGDRSNRWFAARAEPQKMATILTVFRKRYAGMLQHAIRIFERSSDGAERSYAAQSDHSFQPSGVQRLNVVVHEQQVLARCMARGKIVDSRPSVRSCPIQHFERPSREKDACRYRVGDRVRDHDYFEVRIIGALLKSGKASGRDFQILQTGRDHDRYARPGMPRISIKGLHFPLRPSWPRLTLLARNQHHRDVANAFCRGNHALEERMLGYVNISIGMKGGPQQVGAGKPRPADVIELAEINR